MTAFGEHEFEAFFRREHPRLVAMGIGLSGDRELGRELAQEALLRAYRHWPRLREYEQPGAWVRRVLVNLAIDAARSRASERRALQRLATPAPLVADAVADDWWRAVRALPHRQRAAVVLHYLDDLSIDEVAHILEVTSGTVKASLAHARAHLARSMAHESREEGGDD
ncbi:MAG: SigE family RNA polymerase sigma factor [Actinobacteria bacterium]|nr:SigE family RNA polymerase sigma factor [Actinomycetota bacterium]